MDRLEVCDAPLPGRPTLEKKGLSVGRRFSEMAGIAAGKSARIRVGISQSSEKKNNNQSGLLSATAPEKRKQKELIRGKSPFSVRSGCGSRRASLPIIEAPKQIICPAEKHPDRTFTSKVASVSLQEICERYRIL